MSVTERVSIPQKSTFNYSLKVKHIFLTFLQEFCSFQNPTSLLYWNPAERDKSNVMIMDSYVHDLEAMVNQKPLIVLKRGAIYVSQGSMYDNMMKFEMRDMGQKSRSGQPVQQELEYNTFMFSGSIDWHCISRQGLEAEELASNVAVLHQVYKQVLREKGLYDVKSVQVGEETMIEGDVETEMVMVPVSISYEMQAHYEMWSSAPVFETANLYGTADSKNADGDQIDDLLLNTDP